ncbi:DDE-domain-containing protein, partial [Wilcoxina mikolae CBS 423.85]
SHLSLEFCQYAVDHNIALFCFPSHSTHLLQPLDVGLFGPLQKYYGKAADTHMRDIRSGIKTVTFWIFYSQARRKAYTKRNIQAAWKKTGINPFCPAEVLHEFDSVLPVTPATP